jgi:hypothetical protein
MAPATNTSTKNISAAGGNTPENRFCDGSPGAGPCDDEVSEPTASEQFFIDHEMCQDFRDGHRETESESNVNGRKVKQTEIFARREETQARKVKLC